MEHTVLINYLQTGKEEGLTAIFHLYKRPLLYFSTQFVSRQVAEEIVSDTFIKVWNRREQFHNMNSLRAFLYVTAKNACLNHLRKPEAKQDIENIDECHTLLYDDTTVLTKIVQTELLKQIYNELKKLPQKQREVFILSYIDGLTVEEISQKLKITATAVYINRSRAIAFLRNSPRIKNMLYFILFFLQL